MTALKEFSDYEWVILQIKTRFEAKDQPYCKDGVRKSRML